jgi:hypothetical protein
MQIKEVANLFGNPGAEAPEETHVFLGLNVYLVLHVKPAVNQATNHRTALASKKLRDLSRKHMQTQISSYSPYPINVIHC